MATEMSGATSVVTKLPDILKVIEGILILDTNDDAIEDVAFAGFQYLLALEFSRQQPALALLYDLSIARFRTEPGSRRIRFRILIRLKKHVAAQLKKASALAVVAVVLGIPGGINDSIEIYERLFPPTQTELQRGLRSCSPVIELVDVRAPDSREFGGIFKL